MNPANGHRSVERRTWSTFSSPVGIAALAMTAMVSIAVVTFVFVTRTPTASPAAADGSSSLIETVDRELERDLTAALPRAVEGQRLRTMSFGKLAAMEEWIRDLGRQADAEPVGYVVAYAEKAGATRYADENRYWWSGFDAGGNHPLRIHAIAFDVGDGTDLLAGFIASYRAETIGEERDPYEWEVDCRSQTIDDKEIAWCFQEVWGEWSNWYAYADGSVLYLIEGVGDIEGMVGVSETALARLEQILAKLP